MPTLNPRVNVAFNPSDAEVMKMICAKKNISMSGLVRKVVEDWLEEYEDMLLARRAEEAEKRWIEDGCKTISHEELCRELGIDLDKIVSPQSRENAPKTPNLLTLKTHEEYLDGKGTLYNPRDHFSEEINISTTQSHNKNKNEVDNDVMHETIWTYTLGKWEEKPLPYLGVNPIPKGSESFNLIINNKFIEANQIPGGFISLRQLEIFKREDQVWLLNVLFEEMDCLVLVPNTPSLLMFLKEYEGFFKSKNELIKTDCNIFLNKDIIHQIYAEEIDGDENVRVICVTNQGEEIVWFENTPFPVAISCIESEFDLKSDEFRKNRKR
jgi:predicted DNA-binding protein